LSVHPIAEAFDRAADVYDRVRPEYPDEAVDWLVETLGLGPGKTVVDLAAGTGKLTKALLARARARVVAVEPAASMLARLREVAPGAEGRSGTAETIPLEDATADAITVAQAFHWFANDRALAEIHRVLRPGGRLVTQTPVDKRREHTYEDPSLPPARRREVFQTADDVRIYGLDFRDRLAEPGFDVELVDYAAELDPATAERYGLVEQGGRVNGTDIYVAVKRPG